VRDLALEPDRERPAFARDFVEDLFERADAALLEVGPEREALAREAVVFRPVVDLLPADLLRERVFVGIIYKPP